MNGIIEISQFWSLVVLGVALIKKTFAKSIILNNKHFWHRASATEEVIPHTQSLLDRCICCKNLTDLMWLPLPHCVNNSYLYNFFWVKSQNQVFCFMTLLKHPISTCNIFYRYTNLTYSYIMYNSVLYVGIIIYNKCIYILYSK